MVSVSEVCKINCFLPAEALRNLIFLNQRLGVLPGPNLSLLAVLKPCFDIELSLFLKSNMNMT